MFSPTYEAFSPENTTLYSGFSLQLEGKHESIFLWLYDTTSLLFWLVRVPAWWRLESLSPWSSLCTFPLFDNREATHELGCEEGHWSSRK